MSEPVATQTPAPSDEQDLFVGTPYRLVRPIASGGMGEVYLVSHRKLGKKFAAKVLHARLASDPKIVDRLRIEAQALSRFRHTNIVAIMGHGVTRDSRPFIVMEHLRGKTLEEELNAKGSMSVVDSLAITKELLSALATAHEFGIVHRDIKPSNLFLHTVLEGSYTLKVLDFGIARVLPGVSEDAPDPMAVPTASGVLMGTPRYLSPEGAQGQRVDARADLYATGLVLYHMLTGRGPFDEIDRDTAVLAAHAHWEPPPPSRFATQTIPPELDAVVLQALRKNPDERYQTADEFLDDIGNLLVTQLCPPALKLTTVVEPLPTAAPEPAPAPDAVQEHSGSEPSKPNRAKSNVWHIVGIFLLTGILTSLLLIAWASRT